MGIEVLSRARRSSMKTALLLLALVGAASATELTPANWDSEVAGKTIFVKFLAPW